MILDGKSLAKELREKTKIEVLELQKENVFPKLVVIQVGHNVASDIYIRNKKIACESSGILFEHIHFKEECQESELISKIEELNMDEKVHGILIQSPLPKHSEEQKIFNLIDPRKDVDGFTNENVANLFKNKGILIPCTPKGIMSLLKHYQISLEGKHVVVVGRSNIVGLPMSLMALNQNATITICHSKTENLEVYTKNADVLISATGFPNLIKKSMIKEGAVVIDVGINRLDNGHIVGDVDFDEVSKLASYITPVPGGVGPLTIASLLENLCIATKLQQKNEQLSLRKIKK